MSQEAESRWIGQIFAGAKLVKLLGGGAMGVVYEGKHPEYGQVAVKMLKFENDLLSQRFDTEVQALLKLKDLDLKYIASILGYTKTPEEVILMEFIKGMPLHEYIHQYWDKRESVSFRRRIIEGFIPVASDMRQVHKQGIIHRDIKPENFIVRNPDEQEGPLDLCLIDFGISSLNFQSSLLTRAFGFVGTLLYSSPEQLNGDEVDARADTYSFGAMVYKICHPNSEDLYAHLGEGDKGIEEMPSHKSTAHILAFHDDESAKRRRESEVHPEVALFVNRCSTAPFEERLKIMEELEHSLRFLAQCMELRERKKPVQVPVRSPSRTLAFGGSMGEIETATSESKPDEEGGQSQIRTVEMPTGKSLEKSEKVKLDGLARIVQASLDRFAFLRELPPWVIPAFLVGLFVFSQIISFLVGRGCEPEAETSTKIVYKYVQPRKVKVAKKPPRKTLFQKLDKECSRLYVQIRGRHPSTRLTLIARCILLKIVEIKGNYENRVQAAYSLQKKYYDKVYNKQKKAITDWLKKLEYQRNVALEKKKPPGD